MRLTPLFCSFAALAAALLCSCSVAVVPPPSPGSAPAGMAAQNASVQPILRQLAARRAHFLATGNPREVFSVFYRHVTTAILGRVESGTVADPDLILEMMVDFYTDYDRNRSPALRARHWEPYYTLAATARAPDFKTGRELIQRGIEAHIDHDLPDVLTRLFQRHPELRGARLEALRVALESLNDLFLPCSVLGFQDLAKVLPHAPGPRAIVFQSHIARAIITRKRQRAWDTAARGLR